MSDEIPILWCWSGDDCTLHDYATFLSVTSALNISFCIWWDKMYDRLRVRRERSKDERDEKLAKTDIVREDDGGRSACDCFVNCARMVGRAASAVVTVLVVGILLLFRSNSPMSFGWTASTILVGPSLMTITFIVHWVWLCVIENNDAHFARGVEAAKMKAKEVPPSADDAFGQ